MTQMVPDSRKHEPDVPATNDNTDIDQSLHKDAASGRANCLTLSNTVMPEIISAIYPQFILFGDSITQFGAGGIQSTLQNFYIRRLDVLNRGFSGYTAQGGLSTLRQFLPITYPSPLPQDPTYPIATIKLMTVFFGANDACIPGFSQHLPLQQYTACLTSIIQYSVLQRHGTHVILITPPPVDEHQLGKPLSRKAWHTARYAQAARNLATSQGIPCVDVWTAFMRASGYQGELPPPADYEFSEDDATRLPGSIAVDPNPELAELLVDGLHFTSRGYQVLYDELVRVIQTRIPECLPENLPFVFKPWRECFTGEIVA